MFYNKKIANLLIMMFVCILVCKPTSAPADVGQGNSNIAYPTALDDLNGWHGVQVVRSQSEGRIKCAISFPTGFGIAVDERNFLIYMVSQRVVFRSKSSCWISPDDVYSALNQLLHLAVDKQNPAAASLLLYKGTPEMSFNLDGEVAEEYTEQYLIPVLERFNGLGFILDQTEENTIAKSICAKLQWYDDINEISFRNRIRVLAAQLKSKKMNRLARQIQTCRSMGSAQ